MKRLLAYFPLLTILLIGCDGGVDKNENDGLVPETTLQVQLPINAQIGCSAGHLATCVWGEDEYELFIDYTEPEFEDDNYKKWLYDDFRPTWLHMKNQIVETGNTMPHKYLFATIKEFTITANMPVFGREKGANLMDLFYLHTYPAIFSYPEGDMVAYDKEPTYRDISEFIDNGYMSPARWIFIPKESIYHEELPEQIEFTATVTLSTGGSAECKFSPRTK